jgi:streptogramin lyase
MEIVGTCINCLPASTSLLLNITVAAALLGFGIWRSAQA